MAALRIVTTILISPLLTWPSITAFNLDVNPNTVTVFTSPDAPQGKQYFGYSVALHSSSNGSKWVLIGAPLANVSTRLLNHGTVYKCRLKPNYSCREVVVDHKPILTENATLDERPTTFNVEEKTGQWLGAVLQSEDGIVVTCAPRYIYRESLDSERWPLGRCFVLEDGLESVKKILEPCKEKLVSKTAFCQAGMSARCTDKGSVVMGAVGISSWKGGLASYSRNYDPPVFSTQDQIDPWGYMGYAVAEGHISSPDGNEFVGGAPRADNVKGKVLVYSKAGSDLLVMSPLSQPEHITEHIKEHNTIGSYFGSALCAIDLNSDSYTDVLVGAPRFTESIDESRVFVYINNKKGALNPSGTVLKGDNVPRAQFGSAIASIGDINKDGFGDVAIGAPYEKDGAGSGAVYIYHGTREGIESQYRQKILGSSVVQAGLQMFGQSISGKVDVDGNNYPDVAVGAYGSEKVVLLRSRRIVDVTGDVTLSKSRIVLDSNSNLCKDADSSFHECLNVTISFKYSDPTRPANQELTLEYNLELDQSVPENLRRMHFIDESGKRSFISKGSFTLQRQNTFETALVRTVYIMEKEKIADVFSELTFDLTFSLNKTSGCVDSLCPVLNDYMKSAARAVALFQKKCRSDKCILDLAISGKIDFKRGHKELRLGLVNEMTVQLTVENKERDTAYDVKVILSYPSFLSYIGVTLHEHIICAKSQGGNSTSTLICTVGSPANPMTGLSKRRFGVKFSTEKVENDFNVKVEASSGVVEDVDTTNNKAEFHVKVKFDTDLEMEGSSSPNQVVHSKKYAQKSKEFQEDIGPKIVYTLQVRNNGPSPVDGSEVLISIPSLYGGGTGLDNYLLYLLKVELVGTAGTCDVTVNPDNIPEKQNNLRKTEKENKRRKRREAESTILDCRLTTCKTFKCSLGLLQVGSTVEIEITTRLWQSTLVKKKIGVVDLEITALVKLPEKFSQPNKENDRVTIITRAYSASKIVKKGKSTPWYIIFAAVLSGVLLLLIAVGVLYKLGFFKRKRYGKDVSDPQYDETEPMNI